MSSFPGSSQVLKGATSRAPLKTAPAPSFTPTRHVALQRKCACGGAKGITGECEGCDRKRLSLQRSAGQGAGPLAAPPVVHEVLRSPGQPLDARARAFFEPRFGHDFSRVRVHRDAQAAESARAVNARAYTVGQNIVFGDGRYAPHTGAGQRLLAHELTHTIQQSQNTTLMPAALGVGEPNDMHEREASRIADRVLATTTPAEDGVARGLPPVLAASQRAEPLRVARVPDAPEAANAPTQAATPQVETPQAGTPQVATTQDTAATPMSSGPECSQAIGRGQSLPLAATAFRGERGFAHVPTDGHPGSGGLLVTGTSVSIRISAQWEEQIPDPSQRPPEQRNRRPDSPQYYLTFDGWVDNCSSVTPGGPVHSSGAGSPASSVQSGNLAIGGQRSVTFASLIPGRYGLHINPSTASAEPNRVLVGTIEVT